MNNQLPFGNKLAHNIGLIVLASQDLEKHLKFVVAITGSSEEKSIIEQHKILEKHSLGLVVKNLMANVEGSHTDINNFKNYFEKLVERRNKVVHHFSEAYADQLSSEDHAQILKDLAELYNEIREATKAFQDMNQFYLNNLLLEFPEEN